MELQETNRMERKPRRIVIKFAPETRPGEHSQRSLSSNTYKTLQYIYHAASLK